MNIRAVLTLTGIVSAILGALVVYLMMSVPNDLRADTLLKEARVELQKGNDDTARTSLTKIVQQYPRTDAAAAATVALLSLAQKDRNELTRAIEALRAQQAEQARAVTALQKGIDARAAADAAAAEARVAAEAAQKEAEAKKKAATPIKIQRSKKKR